MFNTSVQMLTGKYWNFEPTIFFLQCKKVGRGSLSLFFTEEIEADIYINFVYRPPMTLSYSSIDYFCYCLILSPHSLSLSALSPLSLF